MLVQAEVAEVLNDHYRDVPEDFYSSLRSYQFVLHDALRDISFTWPFKIDYCTDLFHVQNWSETWLAVVVLVRYTSYTSGAI